MITGLNHCGLVVKDLEKSVAFYRDVVGLTLADRRERTGGPISQILGYENTHILIADMKFGQHTLELIQYVNPAGQQRPTEERNVFGASHIAFEVDNIQETYQHLVSNGGQKLNPPVEIVPGKKGCYLQDPDGNWIELLELG